MRGGLLALPRALWKPPVLLLIAGFLFAATALSLLLWRWEPAIYALLAVALLGATGVASLFLAWVVRASDQLGADRDLAVLDRAWAGAELERLLSLPASLEQRAVELSELASAVAPPRRANVRDAIDAVIASRMMTDLGQAAPRGELAPLTASRSFSVGRTWAST